LEIKINIDGDVKEYIDIEDLQANVNSEVKYLIMQAVKTLMRDDYRFEDMIRRTVIDKVASAVLPPKFQDMIAEKLECEIEKTNNGTVNYSWGIADKAKSILESRAEEIGGALSNKLDEAIADIKFSEYEIKDVVKDMVYSRIRESGLDLNLEKIVDDYIRENLGYYIDDKESVNAKA